MLTRWRLWTLVRALAISLVASGISADSKKETKKRVVTPVKLNESLEHLDVFEGIEKGVLDVKMIPNDAMGGNVLVENKGDKPINVDFPAAFVGKQILKQGFGGQQGGGGGGGGFFSVPTDRIIRFKYLAVCLEHGKTEPTPRSVYRMTKVDEFSTDPVLEETLKMVANGQLDPQAGQAAAWHLTDKMSWDQLAAKSIPHIGKQSTPYFSAETLVRARNIHTAAVARVSERDGKSDKSPVASPKNGRTTSSTVKRD